jgi:hypothetical protein
MRRNFTPVETQKVNCSVVCANVSILDLLMNGRGVLYLCHDEAEHVDSYAETSWQVYSFSDFALLQNAFVSIWLGEQYKNT